VRWHYDTGMQSRRERAVEIDVERDRALALRCVRVAGRASGGADRGVAGWVLMAGMPVARTMGHPGRAWMPGGTAPDRMERDVRSGV
jgi:hypothetical protein